jgi:hypothetical protein
VKPLMTMRHALADDQMFGTILSGDSWAAWRVILIAAMGEPLTDDERVVFKELTGRDREPGERVDELWCVIGRRGGKTRAIATLAAYLAALCDFEDILAPGEIASLPILSNTLDQSQKCLEYLRGLFHGIPTLESLIVNETANAITLSTRVCISVQPANWRTVRGGTAVAIVCDEIATWRSDSSANPDVEILAAAKPSLATTGGMLACISSPYARKGVLWEAFKRNHGPDGNNRTIVARAPSMRMNSTLKESWIARQYEDDPYRASAEYGAEFRTDIESFVSREAVERCVSPGVLERPFTSTARYAAFVDAAGGSGQDSMTMAIAHAERDAGRDIAILDVLREFRPPFSPQAVIGELCETLGSYNITKVVGDKFGGQFVQEQFTTRGIRYVASELTKSQLYVELLPRINTGSVDLLDNARMITQLINLERRTGRGTGRDIVDHPRDQHDDLINSAAGALLLASARKKAFRPTQRMIELAARPPMRRVFA